MSMAAVAWALEWAPVKNPQEHVLLIAMANHAHEDGRNAWMSTRKLAERARCSTRTAQRHIDEMEARGLIVRGDQRQVEFIRAGHRPVVWDLSMHLRIDPSTPKEPAKRTGKRQVNRGDNLSPLTAEPDFRGDNLSPLTEEPQFSRGDKTVSPVTESRGDKSLRGDKNSDRGVTQLCHPNQEIEPKDRGVAFSGERHLPDAPAPPNAPLENLPAAEPEPTDAADPEDDPEPSRFCSRHRADPPYPCQGCGEARHQHSQWTARHAAAIARDRYEQTRAAAYARGLAMAACSMCDDEGYIGHRVCDHDPNTVDRMARQGGQNWRERTAEAKAVPK